MNLIGNRIKNIRISKKISQKKLAETIGCATVSIQKYESNERTPSLEVLNKIAVALGVLVSDLVGESNNYDNEFIKIMYDKNLDIEIYSQLLKNPIIEKKFNYKYKEIGAKELAELITFMDQMLEIKINDIQYKTNSK